MDDYLVWRISYTQSAAFGADPFAQLNAPLKAVWLGKAPDIGPRACGRLPADLRGKT
ncbi:hypothetical protein [Citrobacter koseri]|uniref:hypothetical protein n=1 Tax=Citrobacter koseri TaxID=545 RepID=UPI0028691FF6|nr:hypothetical protein [Citrobacter koseri]